MTETHQAESLADVVDAVAQARADGRALETRGGGTVLDRLPPTPPDAGVLDVSALSGVVDHAAADLTVTVRAGTTLTELGEALAAHSQECPIEAPDGLGSTVGGRVATALAGPRQAGAGRVRDWLLRMRFVTGEGRAAKAGGKTVKDVTGYDLCRLLCGSWATVAVIAEVTLKLRPIPPAGGWFVTDEPMERWRDALWWPAAVVTTPTGSHVYLEGHPDDVDEQARAARLRRAEAPELPGHAPAAVDPSRHAPDAVHPSLLHARAAVDPSLVHAFVGDLPDDVEWAAEPEIGAVHLSGDAESLATARKAASGHGGRLLLLSRQGELSQHGELSQQGELPAFGGAPGGPLADRVTRALDPDDTLAPWRWHR